MECQAVISECEMDSSCAAAVDAEEDDTGFEEDVLNNSSEENDGWTLVIKGKKGGQRTNFDKLTTHGLVVTEDLEVISNSLTRINPSQTNESDYHIEKKNTRKRHFSDSILLSKRQGAGEGSALAMPSLSRSVSDSEFLSSGDLNLEVICAEVKLRSILKKRSARCLSECSIDSGTIDDGILDFDIDRELDSMNECSEGTCKWKRKKSVSFSEKVQRATFKSTAPLGAIRTKKRKPRKRKEKPCRKASEEGDINSLERQVSSESVEDDDDSTELVVELENKLNICSNSQNGVGENEAVQTHFPTYRIPAYDDNGFVMSDSGGDCDDDVTISEKSKSNMKRKSKKKNKGNSFSRLRETTGSAPKHKKK